MITVRAQSARDITELKLFDSVGKIILDKTVESLSLQAGIILDIHYVSNGIYYLNVKTKHGSKVLKIVRY